VYGKELRVCSGAGYFFAENIAHAADLGAYAAEFFFEVLVAAIEVVARSRMVRRRRRGRQGRERRRRGGQNT